MPHRGHVCGGKATEDLVIVFVHADIKHLMQLIFDASVTADRLGKSAAG
jgi:hypothetical protein